MRTIGADCCTAVVAKSVTATDGAPLVTTTSAAVLKLNWLANKTAKPSLLKFRHAFFWNKFIVSLLSDNSVTDLTLTEKFPFFTIDVTKSFYLLYADNFYTLRFISNSLILNQVKRRMYASFFQNKEILCTTKI